MNLIEENSTDQQKMQMISDITDYLVNALTDSSASLRRALILIDIDENPNITQAELSERLEEDKSTISRNIEWLFDHGCIRRHNDYADARIILLRSSDFSSRHLSQALKYFDGNHELLKKYLKTLIKMFSEGIPTLREIKALSVVGAKGGAAPADLNDELYDSPASTQRRILSSLTDADLLIRDE